ncbi:hypothetical protein [Ideonella sp.]|uniref:hypothetical protein n=1 Tax=Ideonella sp. TaxID=1929293 RepID=UPI0037BEB0BF
MSRPRLVLHIGPHKTGTTYLQSRLLRHADALRARQGLNYVQAGLGPQYGHHKLCAELRHTGPAEAWAAAAQEWAQYPCHIVSCENFSRLPEAAVGTLAGLLAGLDVELCYLLRSPEALLYAMWQEQVKHGSTLSLPEFLAPHLAEPECSKLLNPSVLLAPYLAAFEGRLRLLSYDAIRASGETLVSALFASLALGPPPAVNNAVENKSMRLERVETLRALNAWEQGQQPPGQDSPHRRADGALFNTRRFLEVANQSPSCWSRLLEAQKASLAAPPPDPLRLLAVHQLRQQFVAQHAQACVGPWPSTGVAPPNYSASLQSVQSDWLLRPGVPQALAELAGLVRQAEQEGLATIAPA